MAGFKTHVSVSGGIGLTYGAIGYACGFPMSTSLVAASLCTLGGMLPDLDGDTGVAVREIIPLLAAAVPILMLDIFQHWGFDREGIFLSIMAIYFLIRFGIGEPFKRLTRHRGMWHSIPAALNVGLICFLVCSYQDIEPRTFKSSAIALGFISHLLLDEMYSLGWFRAKSSTGTAFKFFTTKRIWPNILTYGITILLLSTILTQDATLKSDLQAWRNGERKFNFTPDWRRFVINSSSSSRSERATPPPTGEVGTNASAGNGGIPQQESSDSGE